MISFLTSRENICYPITMFTEQNVSESQQSSQNNAHTCNQCNKVCKTKSALKEHTATHSTEKNHMCSVCQTGCKTKEILKRHMVVHSSEKPFACKVCDRKFSRKMALKLHARTHTTEKPFVCELCHKAFGTKINLSQHVRRHTDVRPYKCEICNVSVKCASSLKYHLLTHSGVKPFACDFCNRKFYTRSILNIHLKTHTGTKKVYVCTACGPLVKRNTFTRLRDFQRHFRRHTGEKPFACDVCSEAFGHSYQLQRHLQDHVGQESKVSGCQQDLQVPKLNPKEGDIILPTSEETVKTPPLILHNINAPEIPDAVCKEQNTQRENSRLTNPNSNFPQTLLLSIEQSHKSRTPSYDSLLSRKTSGEGTHCCVSHQFESVSARESGPSETVQKLHSRTCNKDLTQQCLPPVCGNESMYVSSLSSQHNINECGYSKEPQESQPPTSAACKFDASTQTEEATQESDSSVQNNTFQSMCKKYYSQEFPSFTEEKTCIFCNRTFSSSSYLEKHLSTHIVGAHTCPVCKKIYNQGYIEYHMWNAHIKNQLVGKIYYENSQHLSKKSCPPMPNLKDSPQTTLLSEKLSHEYHSSSSYTLLYLPPVNIDESTRRNIITQFIKDSTNNAGPSETAPKPLFTSNNKDLPLQCLSEWAENFFSHFS